MNCFVIVADISPGELLGRSGSLQAAINLELGTETIHRVNIKLEGLNGQLPNLDLINTVVRLCRREGVPVTLQKRVSQTILINPFPAKLSYLNFHPLEVVSRYHDPQLQVVENVFNLTPNIFKSLFLNTHFVPNNSVLIS